MPELCIDNVSFISFNESLLLPLLLLKRIDLCLCPSDQYNKWRIPSLTSEKIFCVLLEINLNPQNFHNYTYCAYMRFLVFFPHQNKQIHTHQINTNPDTHENTSTHVQCSVYILEVYFNFICVQLELINLKEMFYKRWMCVHKLLV